MTVAHTFAAEKGTCLSARFSRLISTLGDLLEECTNVDTLSGFLTMFSHPLYPERRYVEPRVYSSAKTIKDLLLGLFPQYINYKDHYLLKEIAESSGNDECKQCCQEYKCIINRAVRKLHNHPAPITDDEIEESSLEGTCLSARFSRLICTLGHMLEECTNVDTLSEFLTVFSHLLYPERRYVEPRVYSSAKTVKDLLLSLFPRYIYKLHGSLSCKGDSRMLWQC